MATKKTTKAVAKKATSKKTKGEGKANPGPKASKPTAAKKPTVSVDRNWELPPDAVKELKAQAKSAGSFPNPYRRGAYFYSVEALAALGLNEWHAFDAFKDRIQSLMSDGWQAFADKPVRNEQTGKGVDARLLQNLRVIQRPDYGRKLAQVGAVIDLKREGDTIMVRLNTQAKKAEKVGRPSAK